jgi:hypothetical protein
MSLLLLLTLMERAATKCFEWLDNNGWFVHSFAVFCGKEIMAEMGWQLQEC